MEAGEEFGIRLFGSRALDAMRLEKGFGTWAREYRPIYDPFEAGLDFFLASKRDGYIGKEAADKVKTAGPERKMVTFKVDAEGKNKKTGETWDNTPPLVDATGAVIKGDRPKVGGGSKLAVAYQPYPWYGTSKTVKGAGVSFRLKAAQIVELVEFGNGAGGVFGAVEGGYEAPEQPTSGFSNRSDDSTSADDDPDF